MRTIYFLILTISTFVFGTACQSTPPANSSPANQTENKAGNTDKNANLSNVKTEAENKQPEVNKAETGKTSIGSLATPTDAYRTAYAARKNKDVEGLKRAISKVMIDFFTDIGKSENKSLDDELQEMMKAPQADTDDSRNEKITGDTATLEYRDTNGGWKTMDLVKEPEGWKLTAPGKGKE